MLLLQYYSLSDCLFKFIFTYQLLSLSFRSMREVIRYIELLRYLRLLRENCVLTKIFSQFDSRKSVDYISDGAIDDNTNQSVEKNDIDSKKEGCCCLFPDDSRIQYS